MMSTTHLNLVLILKLSGARGAQIPVYKVTPNNFWSSVWNLLHVAHLAPRFLVWLIDFWKICPLSGAVPLLTLCTRT
jgi:hypothetical protein